MREYSPDELKLIKSLRDTEFFKFDNQSDFKNLRECYKAAKQLYEALKYFDSRSVRFAPMFDSYNQKVYAMKRRFIYPSEYYSFKQFGVIIEIQFNKRTHNYFVSTSGFISKTFRDDIPLGDVSHSYGSTPIFSEVVTSWQKIIFEFLDSDYGLF